MGVLVALKCKIAASSASSGGNSKSTESRPISESSNKSPELIIEGQAISEYMSALLPFKFPRFEEIRRHIRFVRDVTTPTLHVRAMKKLFDIICIRSTFHAKKTGTRSNSRWLVGPSLAGSISKDETQYPQ